jgi:hypothetical protein
MQITDVGEQQQPEWVRLQSLDGFSYLVKRKVAEGSGTIRNMLDSTGVAPFITKGPFYSFVDFEYDARRLCRSSESNM